uniref:TonB-dependent receptor n=1 Tax=Eiseniibacteriota bacterium TaxID=2212470 RepID=A0A832I049_UNCEI
MGPNGYEGFADGRRSGASARPRFVWVLLLAAAAALISPAAVRAGSAADSAAAPKARGVADTVTVLPEVRIDAQRTLDAGRATTTTVRLDRARLARFLPGTASDAILSVPGVDLVKTGPWASRISVRGLAGDRVLVLVDGVRVNGVRGHGAQSSLVAVDRLDAVELQPGASSAQFGSDAMGGVVNFVTHRSLLDTRDGATLTLQGRGSSPDGAWGQSARLRVIGQRFGWELAGGTGGLEALVTPQGRVRNSGNREENFAARLNARLGGTLLDYEHARNAATDIGLPAFSDDNGSTGRYPLQSRVADRFELNRAGHGLVPDARLLAVYQTTRTEFEETTVAPYRVRGRVVGTVTTEAEDRVRTHGFELQPTLRWPGAANLRVSGGYRRESSRGPRTTDATTRNTLGQIIPNPADTVQLGESMPPAWRESWSAAAFAAPVVRGFRFESGVRYDRLTSHADSTPVSHTRRLDVTDERISVEGGIARPLGRVEPYLHAASGFRAPNLEERYYHDEIHAGMTVFGNEDLVAERSVSAEIGVRASQLGPLHNGRLSVYRSNVEDMITIQYLDMLYGRPRFQYRNVKEARIEGLEAAVQMRLGAVQLGLNATAPRAVDRSTGKRLTDAGTARATVDLTVPVSRVVPNGLLSFRVRWNDAVVSDDTTLARPAFSTTAVELTTMFSGMRATFAVRNLFNHAYREPLSFIDEAGRVYALSVRRDFNLGTSFLKRRAPQP